METELPTYYVNFIEPKKLKITGEGNSEVWKKAELVSNFNSPWDDSKIRKIEFKALHDSETLFFCFKVNDSVIHINGSENMYDSINNSDRVELFFKKNAEMTPYYCLEIDPKGRIMDFEARPRKQFDFTWNWPINELEVKAVIKNDYFVVEGAISIKSLKSLGLLKQGTIEVGVYRAKYNKQPEGHYEPTWITWVNPRTEEPNFHIASSFGVFKLVQ